MDEPAPDMTARSPALMVCGTSSNSGKSTIVAGLCRVLARRGLSVAPFKAQNMALNSAVTRSGHEIGRAQFLQAQAAGVEPTVEMNPVLLKPTTERESQVVVQGRPYRNMSARQYHEAKPELLPVVLASLDRLRQRHDAVLLEGASCRSRYGPPSWPLGSGSVRSPRGPRPIASAPTHRSDHPG